MTVPMLLTLAIAIPVAHALLVSLASRPPGLRDTVHIASACALAFVCASLVRHVGAGFGGELVLARPLPSLALAFRAEPMGVAFATTAAMLGALGAVYSVGWMRMKRDPAPARFMAFAALAMAATMGVALAANLFTFFVCYELLAIATFPLIGHRSAEGSGRAAALYLVLTLALAMGALLPAIIWTGAAAGDLAFAPGGLLEGHVNSTAANILLVLYVLGVGMAALFPTHRWMVEAANASAPACALVFAVTAASVGGFGVLRIAAHVFGPVLQDTRLALNAILALAVLTMVGAAFAAFSRRTLQQRLAYLCVAQLAAIVAGALLGPAAHETLAAGWFAAALQLIAYSTATATLCFAIGAVESAAPGAEIDELQGVGRKMPWVFAALALGALSFAGAPPLAGSFPRLWLMIAAADHGVWWAGLAFAVAGLVTFAALAAPVVRALFAPTSADMQIAPDGAPLLVIAPTIAAGAATLMLLFALDPIATFLVAMPEGAP